MNRYPLWKYILIAFALIVGLVYTIPNFFGEVPAVQISPLRSTQKADAALLKRVEDILQKSNIAPQGIFLDQSSVKRRRAQPALAQSAMALGVRRQAHVPGPRLARRRALPAAGRHEGGDLEENGGLHERHSRRAA
jgi:hypothetical protein